MCCCGVLDACVGEASTCLGVACVCACVGVVVALMRRISVSLSHASPAYGSFSSYAPYVVSCDAVSCDAVSCVRVRRCRSRSHASSYAVGGSDAISDGGGALYQHMSMYMP